MLWKEKTTLREGPFAFMDLLDATTNGCTGFLFRTDGVVLYRCCVCDSTFEQTDDGHRALREHEMSHGRACVAQLSELDGRTVRIVAWPLAKSERTAAIT